MLGVLIAKDLRRVRRNPWPWVLNLCLPIAITALFGLAFGGGGKDGPEIARIKVAVVDEDQNLLGGVLRSALSQGEAARRFEVSHPARQEAAALLKESRLSAAVIIPTNFTTGFLLGETNLALEVLKNPAERFYPAIVEELAAVAVTGLNAVHRNLNSEFPRIKAALTNEFDLEVIGTLAKEIGNRLKSSGDYLKPPLVQYESATVEREKKEEGPGMSVFAYILPGMASAFLLFLADHSMRDVHRETRGRTFDRIRTVSTTVGSFVASKVVFSGLSVVLGSAILFGAGAWMFGIEWRQPGLLAVVCLGYAVFAAGLMSMLVALITNERKAETINNMIFFGMAFAGGSYFPAEQMPQAMRENICPLMPNFWFIEAVREMQRGGANWTPIWTVFGLAAGGLILAIVAGAILQRRLTAGNRG